MINTLEAHNFKLFDHIKVDNLKRINFLVGKNNCGKTTLLEALSIMVNPFTYFSFTHIASERQNILDSTVMTNFFRNFREKNSEIQLNVNINGENASLNIAPLIDNSFIFSGSDDARKYSYVACSDSKVQEKNVSGILSINKQGVSFSEGKMLEAPYGKGVFLSSRFGNIHKKIAYIYKQSNEDKIKDALKLFDKRLTNIIPIDDTTYVDNIDGARFPIEFTGDGFKKYIYIISTLLDDRLNYIFLDEIENGLHHQSQKLLLRAILRLSKERNIQMFITTHSYETLKFLSDVMLEDEFASQKDEVQVLNISHPGNEYKVYPISMETLEHNTGNNLEIR